MGGTVSIDPDGVNASASRLRGIARGVAARGGEPHVPGGLEAGLGETLGALLAAERRASETTAADVQRLASRAQAAVARTLAADRPV